MALFYLLFAYVINPKTDIIKKIGDKALSSQKAYNRYFLFMMMAPAMVVALLYISNFSYTFRNVVMGMMLGITVFIGTEVNKYRELKFSTKGKKKKK